MSETEFWHLTPAQFQSYSERANARMDVEDFRFGMLGCIMRQIVGEKKADVFDLFPWRKKSRPKPKQNNSVFQNMRAFAEKLKESNG